MYLFLEIQAMGRFNYYLVNSFWPQRCWVLASDLQWRFSFGGENSPLSIEDLLSTTKKNLLPLISGNVYNFVFYGMVVSGNRKSVRLAIVENPGIISIGLKDKLVMSGDTYQASFEKATEYVDGLMAIQEISQA